MLAKMKFKIDEQIFRKFPGVVIGVVVAEGINNEGRDDEVLGLIREKEKEISVNFNIC